MASVYRKGGRWWLRFKGPDGRWQGAPAKARTKPAARLEALERERSLGSSVRGWCRTRTTCAARSAS
jgi:hypothetical protein